MDQVGERSRRAKLTDYVIEWNQTNKKFRFAVSPHLISADDKVSLYSDRLQNEILLIGTLKTPNPVKRSF